MGTESPKIEGKQALGSDSHGVRLPSIFGPSVSVSNQSTRIKNYVRPVRRIGTEIRSGPVRSAVSDRSRTDLGPDRFDENFFRRRAIFKKKVWSDAVDFVKKSLKSEPSSRFLSRSKFENFACHFLANSADRPRI